MNPSRSPCALGHSATFLYLISYLFLQVLAAAEQRTDLMLLKHTGAVRSSLWRGAKRTQAAEPDDLFICTRSASGRRRGGVGGWGGLWPK